MSNVQKDIKIILGKAGLIRHEGRNCWYNCNEKQGKCSWCGSEGWCCKLGWNGNGCDGTLGGRDSHICVRKPKKGL